MEPQELEKADVTTTSENSDQILDRDEFRYDEKVIYSCLSVMIQLILCVAYLFICIRNVHQEIVLNGVCENAIAKTCRRGNNFCASMPHFHFDSLTE